MLSPESNDWFDQHFSRTRVMVILRGLGPEASLATARRAWAAGIAALEIPVQRDGDLDSLKAVAAAAADQGLVVGAGTVIDPARVPSLRAAGAAYTVSPGLDEEVVRASLAAGLATLPGVATASEIQRCLRLGLHWLKAFPARELGPGWIAAMRAPFAGVSFVATGGVGAANGPAFLNAGARVLALGSAITTDPAALEAIGALAPRP